MRVDVGALNRSRHRFPILLFWWNFAQPTGCAFFLGRREDPAPSTVRHWLTILRRTTRALAAGPFRHPDLQIFV
jgi:hypothetical protein